VSRFIGVVRRYLDDEPMMPILVLFALNAVDEFDTETFNLLGPEIAKHFHVGVGVFGLITVIATLLVPFVSVPVAYVADRRRRMPLAIAGAAAWGMFSLVSGLAPVLWILVASRVGSNFGKVVNEPVHGALIADFYSPKARASAFGIHSLANPVGAAVAAVLGGAIAQVWGWRSAFFILTIPTVVALLFATRLEEPARGGHGEIEVQEKAPPFGETVSKLWAIRSLRYQWIGLAFTSGSTLGIGVLIPFFLKDEFGVEPALRGQIAGVGTALSAVAVIFGARVMQRRLTDSPSGALRLLCQTGIGAGICLFIMAGAPTLWLVTIVLWAILCIFAFIAPGLRAITAVVAPPEVRASGFALGGLVALSGAGFAVIGFVVGDLISVRVAIAVMAPVFLRGVGFFFRAVRYLDDDVDRLRPGRPRTSRLDGPTGTALLEVRRLTVSYGTVRVLFGVNLEVTEGEIVALLGTNGAGKSTTLNAISGLVEPDGGIVFFDGHAITGEAPERTVRRGIVQVPGGRGIFPSLTVEENLRMGGFLRRREESARAEQDDVLALFPTLDGRRAQKAGSLSGGERQMLTLAQSFLLQPRLLLIDELSLGLSPAIVQELLGAVRAMNQRGVSIVLVEQSVNVALTLAARAYFMEKGEVRFSGPTADLLERPDILRSVFLEGAAGRVR